MSQHKSPKQVLLVLAVVGVVYAVNHFFGPFEFLGGGGAAPSKPSGGVAANPPPETKPRDAQGSRPPSAPRTPRGHAAGDAVIAKAFRERRSDFMVTVEGRVSRVLPDDRIGTPHQKFIVELASGRTCLVAHNIKLAPRVPLKRGDAVTVKGEYEWSERGGVLHWTHHDPAGRHEEGWIRHEDRVYK